jgi:hypothetical protein
MILNENSVRMGKEERYHVELDASGSIKDILKALGR